MYNPMKNDYQLVYEIVINSTIPARECDIDTLYRFASGNGSHPLHRLAESISFDEFRASYRAIEKEIIEG